MSRWPDKYVIGLTGNIATGKSIVRKMLEHLGAFGIDADRLAQQAVAPGAPAYRPVIETFGKWIVGPDGKINRPSLAKIVFNDPVALARLEEITHPVVHQAIDVLLRRNQQRVAVIEAIKLLEAGYGEEVDAVWVADAPVEVRLKRLVAKRGLSEAAARLYIEAQPPQEQKLARADVVIDNSGSLENTWKQVQAAWAGLPIAPQPEAITTVALEPQAAARTAVAEVRVRRGTPNNAVEIAKALSAFKRVQVTKADVMLSFGEKAYFMAQAGSQIVGLAGMLVENLVTRVDEFYVSTALPAAPVVQALTKAIEENSRPLEAEIAFLFIGVHAPAAVTEALAAQAYELRALDDIKVPAWREAALESHPPDTQIFAKKLRAERVLKPL